MQGAYGIVNLAGEPIATRWASTIDQWGARAHTPLGTRWILNYLLLSMRPPCLSASRSA